MFLKITKLYYACIVIVLSESGGLTSRRDVTGGWKNLWVTWGDTTEHWDLSGDSVNVNPIEMLEPVVSNNDGVNDNFQTQGWGDASNPQPLVESNLNTQQETPWEQLPVAWGGQESNQEPITLETDFSNTEDKHRTSFQEDGSREQSSPDNLRDLSVSWPELVLQDSGGVNINSESWEVSKPSPERQLWTSNPGLSNPTFNLASGHLSKPGIWLLSKNQLSSKPFSVSENLRTEWAFSKNTLGSSPDSESRPFPHLFQKPNSPPALKLNPSKPGQFSKPQSISNLDSFSMPDQISKLDHFSVSDPFSKRNPFQRPPINMDSMLLSGEFSKRAHGPTQISMSESQNPLSGKYVRKRKDLRLTGDLPVYLNALRRIIHSTVTGRSDMDLNLEFGLFLTQVNLEYSLRIGAKLDKKMFDFINTVRQENKRRLSYLHNKVRNDQNSSDTTKKISSLFSNTTKWLRLTQSFESKDWMFQRNVKEFLTKYSDWGQYVNDIDNLKKWTPNPGQSDICMASLYHVSASQRRHKEANRNCINTLKKCDNVIQYGTDFGYALTHRLLYLMIAKYSRGCNALPVDIISIEDFCMKAYAESLFIAANKYQNIDLLLEQSCLCGFEGFTAFLRRSVIMKILQFQSPQGCFSMQPWSEANKAGNFCNGHVTSVAAATLSTAIRFIIETYYHTK